MVQVRIEIVHGELDMTMMIARRVAIAIESPEMVEVMITNQDNFII